MVGNLLKSRRCLCGGDIGLKMFCGGVEASDKILGLLIIDDIVDRVKRLVIEPAADL